MDLSNKTLAELRAIAREKGLKGVTALRKPELAARIAEEMQQENDGEGKGQTAPKPVKEAQERDTHKTESGKRMAARRESQKREAPGRELVRREQPKREMPRREQPGRENQKNNSKSASYAERGRTYVKKATENNAGTQPDRRAEHPHPEQHRTEYHSEQRTERTGQNTSYYNANQKQRYHDGTDGLISIMKDRQITDVHPTELKEVDSGITKNGILEIMSEGYGFIRCDNFLPGENDVYVAPQFIRRFGLRTGDIIEGNLRTRNTSEKFSALLYMKKVNGRSPSYLYHRKKFEELTPVFPNFRLHLETPGAGISMRMLDLIAPIGKGQRGMIVSQPKTGKTTLLKQVAKAVTKNYPKMNLIILLIDERPEEVTDIKESIEGERVDVIYSTFDELPDNHRRVSEMVIERAKRLVESGEDVIILLDSITRLARAYNLTVTPSGRTLSGGLDPAALHMPKRFFGAARNMREGGSLTILATALVDTGSRMDDVVFEEFKGTGNMELVLDRSLSERRIFPSIDIQKSSTRREDLLLDVNEQEAVTKIRKALGGMKSDQAMEQILNLFKRTKNNEEFVETVKKMHL